MKKNDLQKLLDAEIEIWSGKPFAHLVETLTDVVAYGRGDGPDFHQFEIQMLELEPDCAHICISIDDGSFWRSFAPLSYSFMIHKDGRVER